MNTIIAYILGTLFIIVFFLFEWDIIHLKKNRALYKATYPLDKYKFTLLSKEEQDYLIRLLDYKYKLSKKLHQFGKKKDYNYFGLLDMSNEDRLSLDSTEQMLNIIGINKVQRALGCRLIGIQFTRSTKLILFIFGLSLLSIIISSFL